MPQAPAWCASPRRAYNTAVGETFDPDLVVLATNRALGRLDGADRELIWSYFDQMALPPRTVVLQQNDPGDSMFILIEGTATVVRDGLELRPLGPGDHFGELCLVGHQRRAATITAVHTLRLARLTTTHYHELARDHPQVALRMLEAFGYTIAADYVAMTDNVGQLLGERLLPRRMEVTVKLGGASRVVATGERIDRLLPNEIDGDIVVAGLLDARPVWLHAPVVSDAWIAPLVVSSPEGLEVFRRSAALLALAALARVAPGRQVGLGSSLESARPIELAGDPADISTVIEAARGVIAQMIAGNEPFREETWTVEEARDELAAAGWGQAAALLETWREAVVPLIACGPVYALQNGPVVPHAGMLAGIDLIELDGRPMLTFGERGTRRLPGPDPVGRELELERRVPRFGGEMVTEQLHWQAGLGITSVADFNRACVSGKVDELIRVAEGFQEKRIGRMADQIGARGAVRVITIAGPSSSGKTTFIKRLSTQLGVMGLHPHAVSLDDYYVDRKRTPLAADGEYDFEALEALDLDALRTDVAGLLAGSPVQMPRYDFKAGISERRGGRELVLGPGDVLLLEGIHGLNPALLGPTVPAEQLFRVFLHPATNLPLDHLSRVSQHDIRLLRRIVRDRFNRAITAADNIARWPSVRRGDLLHIYPFLDHADAVFDSALVYEVSVLKVYAERYLLEVPRRHPSHVTADRLRHLIDRFVTIYPDHVPQTSIVREFIGGSAFEY